jgi:serine/threonine protein kinase
MHGTYPQVVICDFGLAHTNSTTAAPDTAQLGAPEPACTIKYTSPERTMPPQSYAPSFKDDVYAFGILMYFIATSETPFDSIPPAHLEHAIRQGARPQGLEVWVQGAALAERSACKRYMRLAQECWQRKPGSRPSFDEIVTRLNAMCYDVMAGPMRHSTILKGWGCSAVVFIMGATKSWITFILLHLLHFWPFFYPWILRLLDPT